MRERTIHNIIVGITVILLLTSARVYATNMNVSINLPLFKVTINGSEISNSYSKYPLFVYKDITYFPMTFAGCRYLGLETKWDQTTGLEINKTNISYPLDEYQTSGLNSNQYIASIPEFKIMINGRTVDNNNAEFPLLIFREITYFPLTWEYAVNEFEWDYRFDPIHGLVITSQNSSPKPLNLIDYIHSESGYGNFIIQGDYIYYAGNEGVVYQAPINDLASYTNIYQLPKDTYFPEHENKYVKPYFIHRDGEVILSYSASGTKGLTYEIAIKADGTAMNPVAVGPFIAPEVSEEGLLLYKTGNVYETETHRYMITSNTNVSNDSHKIYKLNKTTEEITLVSEKAAEAFKYRNEKLYFVSDDRRLYSISLTDDSVQLECNGPVSQEKYEVLGSSIYYFSDTDQRVYKSGENTPLNFGELGKSLQWLGDFVIITFNTTLDNSYRSIVFDQNGVMAFILPRRMRLASADSNKMVYFDEYERSIFLVELK